MWVVNLKHESTIQKTLKFELFKMLNSKQISYKDKVFLSFVITA